MWFVAFISTALLSPEICIDPHVKGENYTNMANELISTVVDVTAIN